MFYQPPYTLPNNNNHKLLKLIKSIPTSPAIPTIPTFSDSTQIIRENTTKLLSKPAIKAIDTNPIAEANNEPSKYVEIATFQPKSLKDQVSTIIFQNFPSIKRVAIENVLNLLTENDDFTWSSISSEFVERRLIFLRFTHVRSLQKFIGTYKEGLIEAFDSTVNYFVDSSVDTILDEAPEVAVGSTIPTSQIKQIISNKNNFEKSTRTGTEDLDQVLTYYNNYQVDQNELVDVPTNMKEVIIKDIVKFRSKVLSIERDNRKKEIELERVKTKERLKRIFEGVSDDMEVEVEEAPSDKNELAEMNDEEYLKYLKKSESEKVLIEYTNRLKKMSKLEVEYKQQRELLNTLKNYELNLIDNKDRYIEEAKVVQNDYLKLYYSDHSKYLKIRSQKRTLEEISDKEDEVAELAQKRSKAEDSQIVDQILEDPEETPREVSHHSVNIVISEFSPEKTTQLQDKILELVEEYLGIKDDFLVKVINESLINKNLEGKQELIDELVEILDDDAKSLVDDLWGYILGQ